jgi:hypothetical protein
VQMGLLTACSNAEGGALVGFLPFRGVAAALDWQRTCQGRVRHISNRESGVKGTCPPITQKGDRGFTHDVKSPEFWKVVPSRVLTCGVWHVQPTRACHYRQGPAAAVLAGHTSTWLS